MRIGRISQLLFSSYSYCARCKTTWNLTESRAINFGNGSGFFAACKPCWDEMSVDERVALYIARANKWRAKFGQDSYPPSDVIEAAVRRESATEWEQKT